jgi:hypothetical protein
MLIRQLAAWFGLLSLLALPIAKAEQNPATLELLNQIRLNALGAQGEFYMLYGVDQNPELVMKLEGRVARVNGQLSKLGESQSAARRSELNRLDSAWQSYAALILQTSKKINGQVVPSGSDVAELLRLNKEITTICKELSAHLQQGQPQTNVSERIWAVKLAMQETLTEYLSYNIGANVLGGSDESVKSLANRASQVLDELHEAPGADLLDAAALTRITRKWQYILSPLKNFDNQNAVPFLVYRYLQEIIVELDALSLPFKNV